MQSKQEIQKQQNKSAHPLASQQWPITDNGISVRRQTTMRIYISMKNKTKH